MRRLLAAAFTSSLILSAAPAEAFDFSALLPPTFAEVFSAAEEYERVCGPVAMLGAVDEARCESLAAQVIEDDIAALRESGALVEGLEHMLGRTQLGAAATRVTDVDGELNRESTETAQHRSIRGWTRYRDIYSCEEYVYKRFQVVRDFEVDVEANANTTMAVLDRAFADDGRGIGSLLSAARPLGGAEGEIFAADQPVYEQANSPRVYRDWGRYVTAPRNDFFDLTNEQIRASAAHSELDDAFLRAGREGTYTYAESGGWRIHENRYQQLRTTPVSTLAFFHDKRRAFRRFIAEREVARQRLLRYAPGVDTALIRDVPRSSTPDASVGQALDALALCMSFAFVNDPAIALDCPGLPPGSCEAFRGAAAREIEEGRSHYCSVEQNDVVHAVMNEFHSYNVELGRLMNEAEAIGCTDGTRRWYSPTGACDWSPEDFISDVASLATAEGVTVSVRMEQERARCVDHVEPGDWRTLIWGNEDGDAYRYFTHTGQVRLNEYVQQPADALLSAADLDQFFARDAQSDIVRLEALDQFADELAQLPANGRPRLQITGSGGDERQHELGIPFTDNDVVAAGYNYAYDVGLIDTVQVGGLRDSRDGDVFDPVADEFDAERPLCRPHPHVAAHFDAFIEGFGHSEDVLNVNLDARVHQSDRSGYMEYRAMLDVEVLDTDIVPPFAADGSVRGAYEWNITSGEGSRSWGFLRADIPIGGSFPLTLTVLGTGTVGARWNVDAHAGLRTDDDGCLSAGLGGSVELVPYGTLSAEGRAGIGYPGLSGGAYVEVDVLEVSLPIEGEVELGAYADGDGEVTIRGSVGLDVTSMSGAAGVYVEALFWDKKWGVDWSGSTIADTTFWEGDYTYSFDFWRAVTCLVEDCA